MIGEIELFNGLSMDRIGSFESMSIDIIYIPPKNVEPLCYHDECDEFLYVVEGELDIYIGDDIKTCKKGEYVCVPKGMKHGSKNTTDDVVELMAICSPSYKTEYHHWCDTGK